MSMIWREIVTSGGYIDAVLTGTGFTVAGYQFAAENGNLAPNPGFEEIGVDDAPISWRTYTDGGLPVYQVYADAGRDGSKCIGIEGWAVTDRGRWLTGQRAIPTEPGSVYRLSGWMKGGIEEGEAAIALNFWGPDPDEPDKLKHFGTYAARPRLNTVPEEEGWFETVVDGILAPEGATSIRIECRAYSGINGSVMFDDIELIREA